MCKKACKVNFADLVSVKWIEINLFQLNYFAFGAGRHDLDLKREVLSDKVWVQLKLNSEEDLVMTPLRVQGRFNLISVNIIE
jgi:hypothetical protein